MRSAFIRALMSMAETDERLWLLCGDLGYSVLDTFRERFPQRFVNVGVAEQNMIGVAAGLALSGKIVFTYSIANFAVMRCLEQVRNDICYHKLDVKIVAVGGGFAYGSAGYSHHALEDVAVMRPMPNIAVVAPGDPSEVEHATRALVNWQGPAYLRLGKGGEPFVHAAPLQLSIGNAIVLREGSDLVFISSGGILSEVMKAADVLQAQGIQVGVISMPSIQPIDADAIRAVARRIPHVITVEEHGVIGGLGEAVATVLSTHGFQCRLHVWAVGAATDLTIASQAELRRRHGLDAGSLALRAAAAIR